MSAEDKKQEKKTMVPLTSSRLKEADYARRVWRIRPEHGVTLKDVIDPAFWSHVAASLRPFDKIEVLADDGSYYAELLVINCGRLWAKVEVLGGKEFDKFKPEAEDADFRVEWKGGAKWCVIRLSDKVKLKEACETREEAETWLKSHVKAMAA